MKVRRRATISVLAIIALIFPALIAQANTTEPANEFFERTWARNDLPVREGQVDRTWIWGPGANTGSMWEQYLESPDGQREVQYYDKSRMEINLTGEPEDSLWYVTNGLLVVEMVTGRIQVGEDSWEPHEAESNNVAGDRSGDSGPSYATLSGLLDAVDDRGDEAITQIVDRDGNVSDDPGLAEQGVHTAHYDEVTGHNVAEPFWEFMTSSGIIYENGDFFQGALFENPVYATGRPITEPYWAHVPVDGVEQWVLLQAFERRVLTFTPGNEEGWQIEAGNVGRHYFEWRHGYPVDHEAPNGDDDNGNDDPPPGNGDDDNGNGGPPPGNGDDDNGNGDPPPGNGDDDNGNGVQPPSSLGLGLTAQVNTLGTQVTVGANLNNPSDWSGRVDLEMRCDGDLVDSGFVNVDADASASASLSYSSGSLLNIDLCTVTALIGNQVVATDTVLVVDLLPDLPLLGQQEATVR